MPSRTISRTWTLKTSASSLRRVLAFVLSALSFPFALEAQGFQLSGRVYSVLRGDTVPLGEHWVVMHEVTQGGGGVVDSVRTDAGGVYFLRSPERDTSAVYLSSVSFRDIAYFSNPVRATAFTSDTASTLLVYDTSSVTPPIDVVQRHVVMRAPEEDGSRSVLELIVLQNRGALTRIANDTASPVWQGVIPAEAVNLEVAPSDVSPEAVYRRGDSVALSAAIPPGEANQKQLVFGYIMPPGLRTFRVPVDQPLDRFQVLIEDPDVKVLSGPLVSRGAEQMEDIQFARFEGTNVQAGVVASFRLSGPSFSVGALLWVIVGMSGIAMAIVLTVWLRRSAVTPNGTEEIDALAAQVAALDERYSPATELTDEARQAYEHQRADLKVRLAQALARKESA